MDSKDDLVPTATPRGRVHVEAPPDDTPQVGEWYWVEDFQNDWLGCVTHVGSNYAELRGIRDGDYIHEISERVHFDHFPDQCRRELSPKQVLASKIAGCRQRMRDVMDEVKQLTQSLGLSRNSLGQSSQAMVVASAGPVEQYEQSLELAKETTLPELRERIHAVKLYAGLNEGVVQISDGSPASLDQPIHLMQRRHYMDEECLAQYEAGGMEFKDIGAFDSWIARPANRDRLLPHPRCVVSFQVRRHQKERTAYSIGDCIRFFYAAQDHKFTYLYIRNGDRLYRLDTEIAFGEKLFPDLDNQPMTQRMWAKMSGNNRVEALIRHDDYQQMQRERKEAKEKLKHTPKIQYPGTWDTSKMLSKYSQEEYETRYQAWQAKYAAAQERDNERRSLERLHDDLDQYVPFDPSTVSYDDISKYVASQMAQHNRVVLVLQGLLDRSDVFHPHPPWQVSTPEGFQGAFRLVLDTDRALVGGAEPDFEAYRANLNRLIRRGSWVTGQQKPWLRHEAEKEIERRDNQYSYHKNRDYQYNLTEYQPEGNPGPGRLAQVVSVTKDLSRATFRWERKRLRRQAYSEPLLPASFTADTKDLLCLDGYKRGDFKIFFADPRTRANYLEWAPLLLAAEDHVAKKAE